MKVQPYDTFVVGCRAGVAQQSVQRPGGEFLRQPHLLVAVFTRVLGAITEARSGKVGVGEEEDDLTVVVTQSASVSISKLTCSHFVSQPEETLERHTLLVKAGFRCHSSHLASPS